MRGLITILSLSFAVYSMKTQADQSASLISEMSPEQIEEICKVYPHSYFCPANVKAATNQELPETAKSTEAKREPLISAPYNTQQAQAYYKYMQALTNYTHQYKMGLNSFMTSNQTAFQELMRQQSQIWMSVFPQGWNQQPVQRANATETPVEQEVVDAPTPEENDDSRSVAKTPDTQVATPATPEEAIQAVQMLDEEGPGAVAQ